MNAYSQIGIDTIIYNGYKDFCINGENSKKIIHLELYKNSSTFKMDFQFFYSMISEDYFIEELRYKGNYEIKYDSLLVLKNIIVSKRTYNSKMIDTSGKLYKRIKDMFFGMDLIKGTEKRYSFRKENLFPESYSERMVVLEQLN